MGGQRKQCKHLFLFHGFPRRQFIPARVWAAVLASVIPRVHCHTLGTLPFNTVHECKSDERHLQGTMCETNR